jgi:hypothetical protein
VAERFYETLALAAFALLGLWWVVVAERRREWSVLPYRRRQAYSVSLYFTMTGVMSLISLISADHPALWRLAFGIAGGIGAIEVVLSLLRASSEPVRALLPPDRRDRHPPHPRAGRRHRPETAGDRGGGRLGSLGPRDQLRLASIHGAAKLAGRVLAASPATG